MIAQVAFTYSFGQIIIAVIVIAAIIGIVLIVLKQSGIEIPSWVAQIGWIVLLAIVAIVAIKFLLGAL